MANLNRVCLIGRLGRDPELRATQDGRQVAKIALATSESWKDGSGQRQSKTLWHRIVCFGAVAELCGKYLAKGSQIYIEGRLQTRDYEKDGQRLYVTEVIAANVQFLDPKAGSASDGEGPQSQPSGKSSMASMGYDEPGTFGDELPF